MHRPTDKTGVLVVRIWTTTDEPGQIRARITRTDDVASKERVSSMAGSIAEIQEAVTSWLKEFDSNR